MPAVTIAWDFTTPADTDALSNGDDSIRSFKQAIMQRLYNGGHAGKLTGSGSTTDENDGRHCAGAALTAGASELAGEFIIYAADKTTALVTFRDSTAATPSEVFLGANGLRTTGALTSATATVGLVTHSSSAIVPPSNNTVALGSTSFGWSNVYVSGELRNSGKPTFALTTTAISSTPITRSVTTKYEWLNVSITPAVVTFTPHAVNGAELVVMVKNNNAGTLAITINGQATTGIPAAALITYSFVSVASVWYLRNAPY